MEMLWLWVKSRTAILASTAPGGDDTSVSLWTVLLVLAIIALIVWIILHVVRR